VDKLVVSYLNKIPLFSGAPLADFNIQKLSGLTNQNFLLSINDSNYVLRIPRQTTNSTLHRGNEAYNQQIAQKLGLAPQALWRESGTKNDTTYELTGASLSTYLNDTTTLASKDFNDASIMGNIVTSLKSLQNSSKKFKGIIDTSAIQKHLKYYFDLCTNEQQGWLKDDYQTAIDLLQTKEAYKLTSRQLVPAHCDLVLENILIDNNVRNDNLVKVWLIDWEYSAMASPFWDVATLCNTAKLNSSRAVVFMEKVFTNNRSEDIETLTQYRYIVKTLSDCWHSAYKLTPTRDKL